MDQRDPECDRQGERRGGDDDAGERQRQPLCDQDAGAPWLAEVGRGDRAVAELLGDGDGAEQHHQQLGNTETGPHRACQEVRVTESERRVLGADIRDTHHDRQRDQAERRKQQPGRHPRAAQLEQLSVQERPHNNDSSADARRSAGPDASMSRKKACSRSAVPSRPCSTSPCWAASSPTCSGVASTASPSSVGR